MALDQPWPLGALGIAAGEMRCRHRDRVRKIGKIFARKTDFKTFESEHDMPARITIGTGNLALRKHFTGALLI